MDSFGLFSLFFDGKRDFQLSQIFHRKKFMLRTEIFNIFPETYLPQGIDLLQESWTHLIQLENTMENTPFEPWLPGSNARVFLRKNDLFSIGRSQMFLFPLLSCQKHSEVAAAYFHTFLSLTESHHPLALLNFLNLHR